MRIGCMQACACLGYCWETTLHGLAVTVVSGKAIFEDVEAFQKACVLGESILQAVNFCCETNCCPELIRMLDITQSLDFYGFFRLPRYFFYPYRAERIDEYALLTCLEEVLSVNWPFVQGTPQLKEFSKEQTSSFLDWLAEEEEHYKTDIEFKTVFKNWITRSLEEDPQPDCDPVDLDLTDLTITLKPVPWLEAFADGVFVLVDIACVPAFLSEWDVLPLGIWADSLGQFWLFAWMPGQVLDDWIRTGMCVGFLAQFFEGFRNVIEGKAPPEALTDAKWLMAASAAEFIYNYSILQQKEHHIIIFWAILAKSLGLLRFLNAPQPSFFYGD